MELAMSHPAEPSTAAAPMMNFTRACTDPRAPLWLRVSARRLIPHARHDHLQLLFGFRTLVGIPRRGMPIEFPHLLQHLVDERPQPELGAAVVHRLLLLVVVAHARSRRRVGGSSNTARI